MSDSLDTLDVLSRLASVIESRKGGDPDASYVARLFHKGTDTVLKKVGEEATETVMAGKDMAADPSEGHRKALVGEFADLWFHSMVAMAHLAYSVDPQWATCAEFGVSVDTRQRGKGLGAKLFRHAVMHARNEGVSLLFVHALSENVAMLKIARHAGARVERDGSESEAYLTVPQATLDSQVSGLFQDQMAEIDYQLKMQAKQFREWLATLQEIRQGVRDARHHQDKP